MLTSESFKRLDASARSKLDLFLIIIGVILKITFCMHCHYVVVVFFILIVVFLSE